MAKSSLKRIVKIMRKLDLCMLSTVDGRNRPDARPMSNNSEVEFEGTSYFFALDDATMVKNIKKNPHVTISFIDNKIFKKLFMVVEGKASISKDRKLMKEHWSKDLEVWFEDGLDTKGLVLIEVQASFIKGWENYEEFELDLRKSKLKAA